MNSLRPRESKLVKEFRQRLENLDFEASDEKLQTFDKLSDDQKALLTLAMDVAYEEGTIADD